MPVDLSAGRHYRGREAGGVMVEWECPSCRGKNIGDPAKGCPACGAGTPQQAAVAAERAKAEAATQVAEIESYIIRNAEGVVARWWLLLEAYTPAARETVGHALEAYVNSGMREEGDLPTVIQIAWARKLLGLDAEGAGPAGGVSAAGAVDSTTPRGPSDLSEDADDRTDDDTITG